MSRRNAADKADDKIDCASRSHDLVGFLSCRPSSATCGFTALARGRDLTGQRTISWSMSAFRPVNDLHFWTWLCVVDQVAARNMITRGHECFEDQGLVED